MNHDKVVLANGRIVLLRGDCLEWLPKVKQSSVDMVFADLPYGTTALDWDKIIPFDQLWDALNRCSTIDAAMLFTSAQPFTTLLNYSNIKHLKHDIIWDKLIGGAFVLAKKRMLPSHENISLFCRGKLVYNPQMQDKPLKNRRPVNPGSSGGSVIPLAGGIARSANDYDPTKSYPTTIISISSKSAECNSTKRIHPTQKPVELLEYLIKTYTNENDIVCDPTMGSGTTGVACAKLKRRFIGIEKDQHYFEIAVKRIQEALHDQAR